MVDIFEVTNRPKKELFYSRGDAYDVKLGEDVLYEPGRYNESNMVIIGAPQDEGVKRNKGREGAQLGPSHIRHAFYRLSSPRRLNAIKMFDLGDLKFSGSLEDMHSLQTEVVGKLLRDGKFVAVLGGGNDISYANFCAIDEVLGGNSCSVINVDSHLDLREAEKRNSGTPFRQMIDEGRLKPECLYELGIQEFANSETYIQYAKKNRIHVYSLEKIRKEGIKFTVAKVLSHIRTEYIYLTFDLDVVRGSDAPGVSASYPTGLTADEIVEIAELIGKEKRVILIDFTEVNPVYDIDNRTGKLTSIMLWKFISNKVEHYLET